MWEWINRSRNKNNQLLKKKSLTIAYNDLLKSSEKNSKIDKSIPSLEDIYNIAYDIRKKCNLTNASLSLQNYTPLTWEEMSNNADNVMKTRFAFLKTIAYSYQNECIRLGLNFSEIELLKKGITPENFNTHLKIPLDFGGKISLSNFSLIKTHKTHENIHHIIDSQIAAGTLIHHKKIFLPHFEGTFYYD